MNQNQDYINIETMDKLFDDAVAKYGDRKCFGVREVFGEEEETVESGKVFKKVKFYID